jgi:3-oxoacyl-[acyl-carrier protein] reductase
MRGGLPVIFDLNGRVALVTGAGQNVGNGIAAMLAAQGATVAINDYVPERAAQAASVLGGSAIAAPFDVTELGAVTAGVADITERVGPIDILVNNAGNGGAGGMRAAHFRQVDPSEWSGPVSVNLFGVMNCCKAIIDGMCDQGWDASSPSPRVRAHPGSPSAWRRTAPGRAAAWPSPAPWHWRWPAPA